MSKWRPLNDCIYIVPDIHGNVNLLEQFLARVEPLRKSDQIIFLGDYIDRNKNSHLVLDRLIELKNKYSNQIIFLMGNHEEMLLATCNKLPERLNEKEISEYYKVFFFNGGINTIYGYLERLNLQEKIVAAELAVQNIMETLVPDEHIKFLQSLKLYHETNSHIFVHAGCTINIPLSKQSRGRLLWNRDMVNEVVESMIQNKNLNWPKTVITGHSFTKSKKPILYQEFMMLDCGAPEQLLVVELNSMEAFMIHSNKSRMLKYSLEENKFNKNYE